MNTEQVNQLRSLKHKIGVNPDDWVRVHPNLVIVVHEYVDFASHHDLPIEVTSIIRVKIPGISKSDTHSEGRAADFSVRGWPQTLIEKCVKAINEKLKVGAVSFSDHIEREAVYEDGKTAGTAPHIHLQVRR